MKFPEKLVLLRRRRGLTQQQLAQSLNVTRQAVSRWENGASLPDSVALLRLAEEFDVAPEWLLDDDAEGEPTPRCPKRGHFTATDRAWSAAAVAGLVYTIAYNVLIFGNMEGLAVQLLQGGSVYRLIMALQYLTLVLIGPWFSFALMHTAAALFCRYAVTPGENVQRWMRRAALICLLIYAVMFVLSIALRITDYEYGGTLQILYSRLVSNSWYMSAAGALFGLSRTRPTVSTPRSGAG